MYRFCNFSWESLISISLRQGWIELSADDSAETMDSPLSGVIRVSSDRPLSLFIYIFNANIPYIFFVYENDLLFCRVTITKMELHQPFLVVSLFPVGSRLLSFRSWSPEIVSTSLQKCLSLLVLSLPLLLPPPFPLSLHRPEIPIRSRNSPNNNSIFR